MNIHRTVDLNCAGFTLHPGLPVEEIVWRSPRCLCLPHWCLTCHGPRGDQKTGVLWCFMMFYGVFNGVLWWFTKKRRLENRCFMVF